MPALEAGLSKTGDSRGAWLMHQVCGRKRARLEQGPPLNGQGWPSLKEEIGLTAAPMLAARCTAQATLTRNRRSQHVRDEGIEL